MATHGGNICRECFENPNGCECENDCIRKNGTTKEDREPESDYYPYEPQSDYEAILAADTAYRLCEDIDGMIQPDKKLIPRIQSNALLVIDKALQNLKKSYE